MSMWKWMIPGILGATAGALLRSQYERDHFLVEETVIYSDKINKPYTLVFLSDLHDKEFGTGNRALIASIARTNPDAILFGGDTMVVKHRVCDLGVTEHLLRELVKLCPVFYGNGNHEQRLKRERGDYKGKYSSFLGILRKYGVTYLQDSTVTWGDDLAISGLDIDPVYYKDFTPEIMKEAYITKRLGQPKADRFHILLAHSPLFFDAYEVWGADLTLSGHFHGGTIRLPIAGGIMTPQFQFFLPWCAGEFEKKGHHLIVSRGLGTHSINIRLGNRPQVIVIKLEPGER